MTDRIKPAFNIIDARNELLYWQDLFASADTLVQAAKGCNSPQQATDYLEAMETRMEALRGIRHSQRVLRVMGDRV